MRSIFTLACCVCLGCGAPVVAPAEPAREPVTAEPVTAEPVAAEPVAAEPVAVVAVPLVCIDAPERELLACAGVATPVRPHDELASALTARSRARQTRRAPPMEHSFEARPFDDEEAALAGELRADRCARPPGDPERAQSTYWLARLHYEANHAGAAAVLFDEVALDHQAGDLAVFAANLALDALNIRMRTRDGAARDDCLATFRGAVDRYRARFCAPVVDEELCRTLEILSAQLDERDH